MLLVGKPVEFNSDAYFLCFLQVLTGQEGI